MAELFTCCLLPLAARQVNEMQLRNRQPRVYSMLRWSWWSWCFLQLLFLTWDFTAPKCVYISFYSGTVQIIFGYFWTAVQKLDWLIWYYLRGGILRYTVSHRGSSSSTPRDIRRDVRRDTSQRQHRHSHMHQSATSQQSVNLTQMFSKQMSRGGMEYWGILMMAWYNPRTTG